MYLRFNYIIYPKISKNHVVLYQMLQNSLLSLWVFFVLTNSIYAQIPPDIWLGQEPTNPKISTPAKEIIRYSKVQTIEDTLLLPFWDDFSDNGNAPDSTKWLLNQTVHLSRTAAILPPTIGVASFDGANNQGVPYAYTNQSGWCDSLISQAIDLSQVTAKDSLYLTFFIQRGGLAEPPEKTDSFVVWFRDTTTSFPTFRQVWSTGGGQPTSVFQRVHILIKDSAFFHQGFQIRFQTKGAQYAYFDVWHLDYVYLNKNRTAVDTNFFDKAIVLPVGSIYEPYTAIPQKHYKNLTPSGVTAISTTINNLSGSASANVNTEITLFDSLSGRNLLGNITQQQLFNITTPATIPWQPYDFQNFDTTMLLTVKHYIPDNDLFPQNNTAYSFFRVDSVLAYDDGEPETGFGMNAARGFGQQLIRSGNDPDSLRAVWICFVPQLGVLDGKGFKFTVWKNPHPDSILYEQYGGMRVDYGGNRNSYVRFPLDSIISLPDTCWIGLTQPDNVPIGVGFDLNRNSGTTIFRDSLGNWRPFYVNGSLMIRPELSGTPIVLNRSNAESTEGLFHLFPNPASDYFCITYENSPNTNLSIKIYNMLGKEIFCDPVIEPQLIRCSLTSMASGWYQVQVIDNKNILKTWKLWKN